MDECTIKSLLTLEVTKTANGTKVLLIPYEDILRGKISIRINDAIPSPTVVPPPATPVEEKAKEDSFRVAEEIQKLYKDKNLMAQDVVDYLKTVASAWEYRGLGLKTSLLKKVAAKQPNLNSVIFKVYGKEGDTYLSRLIEDNMFYIKQCWAENEN